MSLLSPSLLAFRAVVDTGTVLEAANRVHLTQTGVTQRIRSLEKQLGVTLFTRSRKGMRLTQEGKNLLEYVQAVEVLEGETLKALLHEDTASAVKEIKISGSGLLLKSFLNPSLGNYLKKIPTAQLRIQEGTHAQCLEDLKNGKSDFSILPEPLKGAEFASLKLRSQLYCFVQSYKSRTLTSTESFAQFVGVELAHENSLFQTELKKHRQLQCGPIHHVTTLDSLLDIFAALPAVSLLPLELAKDLQKKQLLKIVKWKTYTKHSFFLCYYPRKKMPPHMQAFISALRAP